MKRVIALNCKQGISLACIVLLWLSRQEFYRNGYCTNVFGIICLGFSFASAVQCSIERFPCLDAQESHVA